MNDDTHAVYEALANIEILYNEMESAARYSAAVTDNQEDFREELADELARIISDNREVIPGFSHTEPIDYSEVQPEDIAEQFDYDDYK